ncbi:MAG: sel1 repeat family protein [Polyangiaceae bacterium]|nr:sel1 repeat family protein [Polyangiaceae bacterium]
MGQRWKGAAGVIIVASLAAASCGGGNLTSQTAKPPEFAPKDQAKCGVTKSQARPLIVEWPSSDRAALEARVKQGIVAVRYAGCEMEVLTRCQVPKTRYGYTGITKKSDRIVMRDADELYANIPVYAAKFEGTLQRAGALTVSMTIVGRYEADRPTVRKADLTGGDCEGATHVISALTVGAFEFFTGAEAEAGASVEAAGAGAGARSTSQRETLNRDGDDASCDKAKGEDTTPPFGCGALLRVEVVPLGGGDATAEAPPPPAPPSAEPSAAKPPSPPPAAATCSPGDAPGCAAACDQGDAASCVTLGMMHREGKGAPKDSPRAVTLLQKGCDGGQLKGCVQAGEILYNVAPKDQTRAAALFKKACDGGEATGCVDLGWAYSAGAGVPKDSAASAAAFGKACTDTEAIGCVGLGQLYRDGKGVPQDRKRAGELFKKACSAGITIACSMSP